MSFFLIQNSFLEWAYLIDNSYFSFFPTPIILNDSRIGLGSRSFLYFEVSFFVDGALSAWHSASSFIWKTGSLVKRRDFHDWEEAGCAGPDWFLSLGKHVSCLDPHAVCYQGPHSSAGVCSDPFCLCPCGQVSFIVVFIIRKPTYPPIKATFSTISNKDDILEPICFWFRTQVGKSSNIYCATVNPIKW